MSMVLISSMLIRISMIINIIVVIVVGIMAMLVIMMLDAPLREHVLQILAMTNPGPRF